MKQDSILRFFRESLPSPLQQEAYYLLFLGDVTDLYEFLNLKFSWEKISWIEVFVFSTNLAFLYIGGF